MDKKTFSIFIIVIAVTFAVTMVIKFYHPKSNAQVNFDNFLMTADGWSGFRKEVPQYALDLLNPMDVVSATYTNEEGVAVHLFFDFFTPDKGYGGPHSPHNCLPGSGWLIVESNPHTIELAGRKIDGQRLKLRYKDSYHIMDFWYVTHFGETGNDYMFKVYEILGSLSFKPKDVAFIRFVTEDNSESEKALNDFQKKITPEIYRNLPFDYGM